MLFIFLAVNVNAQGNFSVSKSFNWLNDTMDSSNWNRDVDEISMAILALRSGGYDVSGGVNRLLEMESNDNWGDIDDTALAVLALSKEGRDVSKEIEWLVDEEERGDSGEWLIQIVAGGEGTCILEHSGGQEEIEVNGTEVTCRGSGEGSMFDVVHCIGRRLDPYEVLDIDCGDVGEADVNLLYRENFNYYLLDDDLPLEVKDACYDNCRYRDAAYVAWVLYAVGEEEHSSIYLDINRNDNVIGHSVLSLITREKIYSNWLKDNQQLSGSWNGDVTDTAFGYLALSNDFESSNNLDDAEDWFADGVDEDGSFDQDIFETALVLYVLNPQPVGTGPFCGDGVCSAGGGETINNCPSDCGVCGDGLITSPEECEFSSDCSSFGSGYVCQECLCVLPDETACTADDECMNDFDCEVGEICNTDSCQCEVSSSEGCLSDSDCPTDYLCNAVTGTCDYVGGEGEDEGEGEEESSSFLIWAFVLVGFFVLALGAYFFYMRRKGGSGLGKKKKPGSFEDFLKKRQQSKPASRTGLQRVAPPARKPKQSYSATERALDESIKKAKDLIGKK